MSQFPRPQMQEIGRGPDDPLPKDCQPDANPDEHHDNRFAAYMRAPVVGSRWHILCGVVCGVVVGDILLVLLKAVA